MAGGDKAEEKNAARLLARMKSKQRQEEKEERKREVSAVALKCGSWMFFL